MELPATALFVRSASPGAILRFLERRNDPDKPSEVLLSEAVGQQQWRTLFGPASYLNSVASPLSVAFPPEVIVAARLEKMLTLGIYKAGELADVKTSADSQPTGIGALLRFNALATPSPIFAWAKEKGIPTRYIKEPPKKVIDYDTVGILDQRKLLVEDSPRLYRFPLL